MGKLSPLLQRAAQRASERLKASSKQPIGQESSDEESLIEDFFGAKTPGDRAAALDAYLSVRETKQK